MWAGQGAHLCRDLSAAELLRELVEGFDKIVKIS